MLIPPDAQMFFSMMKAAPNDRYELLSTEMICDLKTTDILCLAFSNSLPIKTELLQYLYKL